MMENSKNSNFSAAIAISVVVISLGFIIFSLFARFPNNGNKKLLYNYDATSHVVMTMNCMDAVDWKTHHFLPIMTFPGKDNLFINNGPSLLMDRKGYSYYISFPPAGFFFPYFFLKLFRLPLNERGLFIFNSFLMISSVLIFCFLLNSVLKDEIASNSRMILLSSVALLYCFTIQSMISFGITYWHHSLYQLFFMLQVLLFYHSLKDKKFLILFFVLCVIGPCIEWTGFLVNFILAVFSFILEFKKNPVRKNIFSSMKISFIIGLLTVASLMLFLLHFASLFSLDVFFEELFRRYQFRSSHKSIPFINLLNTYNIFYAVLLLFAGVSLFICLIFTKVRKEFWNMLKKNSLLFFIFLGICLENIILMPHACSYPFATLKIMFLLLFLYSISACALIKSNIKISKAFLVLLFLLALGCSLINMKLLFKKFYVVIPGVENNERFGEYIRKTYPPAQSIYINTKWRAWGYFQNLLKSNIYSSSFYPNIDFFMKKNKNYIVFFLVNSEGGKIAHPFIVVDKKSKTTSLINILFKNDGTMNIISTPEKYHLPWIKFYLTDSKWIKGYLRNSGGFFVPPTAANIAKFKIGRFVILPNGSSRKILTVRKSSSYLDVYTSGSHFQPEIEPHKLIVINSLDYYLTDHSWIKGYFRRGGGFFVPPTAANLAKFKVGRFVILPDGSARKIQRTTKSPSYLNVFTGGAHFTTPLKPHELTVRDAPAPAAKPK